MNQLDTRIASYQEAIFRHYRWLHAHPKLTGCEKETAALNYLSDA